MPTVVLDKIGLEGKNFKPGKFYKIEHFVNSSSRTLTTSQGMFVGNNKAIADGQLLILTFEDADGLTKLASKTIMASDVTFVWEDVDKFAIENIKFNNIDPTPAVELTFDCREEI